MLLVMTIFIAISQGNFNLFYLTIVSIHNPISRKLLRITALDEYLNISISLNVRVHRHHGLARALEWQLDSVNGSVTFTSKIRGCITDRCADPSRLLHKDISAIIAHI